MKTKLFFSIALMFIGTIVFAGDIIVIKENISQKEIFFEGEVTKIKDCTVFFKAEGKKYPVCAQDVLYIFFENPEDKVYLDYLQLNDADKCMKGQADAEMYHGKTFGHVALGILFGPFAVIGTAAGNPSPQKGANTYMMSQNKELFSDPVYLMCYKKKARSRNVTNAALGWGAWVLFVLIYESSLE